MRRPTATTVSAASTNASCSRSLTAWAFSRASRLPLARRVYYLDKLEHCKIALLAMLLVAFKLPITMIAYEMGPELRLTGFDRETIATPRRIIPQLKVIGE